jgi:predicted transcriptional regulator
MKTETRLTLVLTDALAEAVAEVAKATDRSRAAVCRLAILAGLPKVRAPRRVPARARQAAA